MKPIGILLAAVLLADAAAAVPPRPREVFRDRRASLVPFLPPPPPFRPLSGGFRVLVILVEFSDQPATVAPEEIEALLFGATGRSMRDYYLEASGGVFGLEGSVVGWVAASGSRADYGANLPAGGDAAPLALAEEAVLLADDLVDFSVFDNNSDGEVDGLLMVHSGLGEETGDPDDIWSHSAWMEAGADGVRVRHYGMGPELQRDREVHLATIGVYCHELAHNLGLPDLYDTSLRCAGIGDFGLMGTGAWGVRDAYPGDGPVHPCAWSLLFLGWAEALEMTAGSYRARPGEVYRTTRGCAPGEAFLLENRVQEGFDAGLPGGGVLIWHVDDSLDGNDDPLNLQVDLEEADGAQDLELSPQYPGAPEDFFFSGNRDEFGPQTRPDSSSHSGQPTGVRIFAIGPRGVEMPFTFGEVLPAPWADAGGPYLLEEGGRLTLDGSRSVGADGYFWDLDGDLDFDDAGGSAPEVDGSGMDGPSEFRVYLRVSGPGGEPDQDDALVEVVNLPPQIVRFDAPEPLVAGLPAWLAIQAEDPCPVDLLSWEFDLGGGKLLQVQADRIEVLFELPGTFHLRAEVADDDGGSALVERDVLVVPSGAGGGGCGCRGSPGGALLMSWFLLTGIGWGIRATS